VCDKVTVIKLKENADIEARWDFLFQSTADALRTNETAAAFEFVAFYALCFQQNPDTTIKSCFPTRSAVCVNEHQFVVGGYMFPLLCTDTTWYVI
jgi:hypothetical protein